MPVLCLATWNIEHFGALLAKKTAGTLSARDTLRLAAIATEIRAIEADILCVVEGPKPDELAGFCAEELAGEWVAILRAPGDPYVLGNGPRGPQTILFIARPAIAAACKLEPVARWRGMTERASRRTFAGQTGPFGTTDDFVHKTTWKVSHPYLDKPQLTPTHKHHRHPQVLVFNLRDRATGEVSRVEVIGAHMKSKINFERWRGSLEDSEAHVRQAVAARIKLSSEAVNLRYYLEERFDQDVEAAIFVVGDFNDGPGKDLFEEVFLLHDLIGNLQGDVFLADRFLNHALFDFNGDQRWSAEFVDAYDRSQQIRVLIDHILFSQRLVRKDMRKRHLWVGPFAGKVEHEVHGAINADLPASHKTSDHIPVTCRVTLADDLDFEMPVA